MQSTAIRDMTSGSPAKLLLSFALPLMLGNVFQQFYTIVDTAFVGKCVGVEALASMGAADWLNWLVLSSVVGFAQGFSIPAAQRFGAGDTEGLKRICAVSYLLTGLLSIAFTAASLLALRPVLLLLRTPDNVIAGAETYLRIIFSGIIIVGAYNILSSILRALGDSRTPLIAMSIAAVLNVLLDALFIVILRWGIAGAAVATVIAQCVSCLWCLRAVMRIDVVRPAYHHLRPNRATLSTLLKTGSPLALQNMIIAVGGLAVQYVINGFGFIFLAGFTATNKLYGLLELAATSFGFSMMTYAGQNLGAGEYGRIRKGMRSGVVMAIATSLVISAIVILFGRGIVSIFITAESEVVVAVTDTAYTYLRIMGTFLPILYLLHIYRSALQGMGDTIIPMVSGIIELAMRIGAAMLLPMMVGEYGIFFAEVLAWTGAAVILITTYYVRMRKGRF